MEIRFCGAPVLTLPDTAELTAALGRAIPAAAGGVVDFQPEMAVPDYVRYTFTGDNLKPVGETFFNIGKATIPRGVPADGSYQGAILFILESPHTDEITADLSPRWPAAGATGAQIEIHRQDVARLLRGLAPEGAPVILCNPVPYPTSLRLEPLQPKLRDKLFAAMMSLPAIRQSFRDRLQRYSPNVIMNACTGGEAPGSPRSLVRQVLDEMLAGLTVARHHYKVVKAETKALRLAEQTGSVNAQCHVVELPHPAGWIYIKKEAWPK